MDATHPDEATRKMLLAAGVDPDGDSNTARIFRAKPGEIVQIKPLEIDTGWLRLVSKCPACDMPHLHIREADVCKASLLTNLRRAAAT